LGTFPGLLVDKSDKPEEEFKDYSYAFYTDDMLVGQSGSYVYSVVIKSLMAMLKKYTMHVEHGHVASWLDGLTRYSHLLIQAEQPQPHRGNQGGKRRRMLLLRPLPSFL
jgi:two-component system nitrogen regulation sensor histidine kinase NtrY